MVVYNLKFPCRNVSESTELLSYSGEMFTPAGHWSAVVAWLSTKSLYMGEKF